MYSSEFKEDCLKLLPAKWEYGDYYVCYANTNAKINLAKSFEAKYSDDIDIWFCDFSNTDLSNDELEINGKTVTIMFSNFSSTNISLPIKSAASSDLSNNDLSQLEIDANDALVRENFEDVNLTNTGALVNIDYDKIAGSFDSRIKEELKNYMEEYWVGCYVNGVLVKSPDEKKKSAEVIRKDYEQFKNTEFASVLGSISEQIGDTGRKR